MAAFIVAFDGTRVNAAEANTNWTNLGGGGPTPAAEPQLVYQGTNAVNRKVTSTGTTRTGVQYDPAAAALDMTAAANILWFVKTYVADFGDLNTTYGVELRIGSSSADYYAYNVAGTGANRSPIFDTYPAQGGYLILALDPNIAAWREATGGTPSLTAVDYFGVAAGFVVGGAKSENVALDSIDVGTGLTVTRGDGADPDASFQSFVENDADTSTNRWGVVVSKGGATLAVGMLTVGESGTATEFVDTDSILIFPDGYHSAGAVGVTFDISNASTTVDISNTLIGNGVITTEDTRPDLIVTGTAGTFDISASLTNFRNVTFTSVCAANGARLECQLLTQSSADLVNCTITTRSLTSIATLQDPTFGTVTDLNNTTFVQGGAGHAVEISTAGNYTFTELSWAGYGADTTDSAALDLTAATGTYNLTIDGGTTPTFKKLVGATVNILNNVTITLTGLIALSEVRVYEAGTLIVVDGIENSGVTFSFADAALSSVDIRVFHLDYQPVVITAYEVPSVNTSLPIQQIIDRVFDNPV